ncbi:helix-turn-helix domain-containing protein [Streptomyces tsukubensis]|uniref:Transcriptional regulator n=1 Tax=Streptomyces tsukubensis TaxID=83656 RepID=A0A1V4A482_9ACTN|nr:helix-turn-helix domain-containing protein [Streptomyces tsukubensis]OON74659.1 transcriptional regulator [Streptomyces tsukubensis]QFR93068.1 transcriptional regulator [Streptomyces tsukubensis]
MYDSDTRADALSLLAQGHSLNSISVRTGISRATVRSWRDTGPTLPSRSTADCPRCCRTPRGPEDPAAYSYLLGLYLGDGCLTTGRRGVHLLRIACADAWPGLIRACGDAVRAVRPDNRVWFSQRQGCVAVSSTSKHWVCLFPQHGPGRKHDRHIFLQPWQREIVDAHPWEFVRGLIHSDGSRIINWTEKLIAGKCKRYEYARYFFTNRSDDIRKLYTDTLDRLGVEWTMVRRQGDPLNISVARKASVALMDKHVGPKY